MPTHGGGVTTIVAVLARPDQDNTHNDAAYKAYQDKDNGQIDSDKHIFAPSAALYRVAEYERLDA